MSKIAFINGDSKFDNIELIFRFGNDRLVLCVSADKCCHTIRKVLEEVSGLSNDISQALSFHPSAERSGVFHSRISALSSEISSILPFQENLSFPRPLHPSFPDQETANVSIASALDKELEKVKEGVNAMRELADEYSEICEQVDRLEKIKDTMESLSNQLDEDVQYLTQGHGRTKEDLINLAQHFPSCLEVDIPYLMRLQLISESIKSINQQSVSLYKDSAILLFVLKQHIGIDPVFRHAVESASVRLRASLVSAVQARDFAVSAAELMDRSRELEQGVEAAEKTCLNLRDELLDALDRARWTGLDPVSDRALEDGSEPSFVSRLSELQSLLSGPLASSLDGLLTFHGQPTNNTTIQHISSRLSCLRTQSGATQELARLLSLVRNQDTGQSSSLPSCLLPITVS